MIPKFFHRGDSDPKGIRKLRETIDKYQLQTNLINGGNGREISEKCLLDLIDKHVNIGWPKSHFLSFSENEIIAFRYGINCEYDNLPDKLQEYSEYFENDIFWDFAILTISNESINWKRIGNGIYEGLYKPFLKEFKDISLYRILGINVGEALSKEEQYRISLDNAKRDKEWLILPATLKQFKNGIENSAIIDGACISSIKKFKLNY